YCELFESPMSSLRRIWRLRRLGMPRLNPWRRALWYFRFLFAKHSDQHHQYSQSVLAQSESSGSPHKSLLNKTA
ncbi:MAG: hypothetical protein QGF59_27790, partial [Pirellulaceae bacterium]|nr:hypothetical protein [Pirellulaceae bacterium]